MFSCNLVEYICVLNSTHLSINTAHIIIYSYESSTTHTKYTIRKYYLTYLNLILIVKQAFSFSSEYLFIVTFEFMLFMVHMPHHINQRI